MNEQEQPATSTEAVIETQEPEEKTREPENKPKSRRGAIGKLACPICQEKWHPRRNPSLSDFIEAHKKEHAREDLKREDFRLKSSAE